MIILLVMFTVWCLLLALVSGLEELAERRRRKQIRRRLDLWAAKNRALSFAELIGYPDPGSFRRFLDGFKK